MFDPLHPFQCDGMETEMDPGKDLFALLFMSFFLIAILMLISVGSSHKRVVVNTSRPPSSSTITLELDLLGRLISKGNGVELCQGSRCWLLPDQASALAREARFIRDLRGRRSLIVEDPGDRIGAGTMLAAVNSLNQHGIAVEFRTRLR